MLTYIKTLPKDAKQISGYLNWCTPDGVIYGKETRTMPNRFHKDLKFKTKNYGKYFIVPVKLNHSCGYLYANLKHIDGQDKYSKRYIRANRVIAQTFLVNPEKLPIVGHKNNIKTDNRVDNLYWTTNKENIQKAVDDGLLVNDKGYEDSQSKPVIMYDTKTNKELGRYGSISEATIKTGLPKSTIARQAKYHRPVRKPYYFRYQD